MSRKFGIILWEFLGMREGQERTRTSKRERESSLMEGLMWVMAQVR